MTDQEMELRALERTIADYEKATGNHVSASVWITPDSFWEIDGTVRSHTMKDGKEIVSVDRPLVGFWYVSVYKDTLEEAKVPA